jgi:hypothetical protein
VAGNMQLNQWTVRMAVHSKAIRSLRTVYSVPERYAQAVKRATGTGYRCPTTGP